MYIHVCYGIFIIHICTHFCYGRCLEHIWIMFYYERFIGHIVVMEDFVRQNAANQRQAMPLRQQLFRRALRQIDRRMEGFSKPRLVS